MSLKNRLILTFLAIGFIPLILTAVVAYYSSSTSLKSTIGHNEATTASLLLKSLEANIEDNAAKLKTWSGFESFITASEIAEDDGDRTVHATLANLKKNYNANYDIHLYAFDDGDFTRIAVSDDKLLKQPIPKNLTKFANDFAKNKTKFALMPTNKKSKANETIFEVDMFSAVISDDELVGVLAWEYPFVLGAEQTSSKFVSLINSKGELLAVPGFFNSAEQSDALATLKNAGLTNYVNDNAENGYFMLSAGTDYLTGFSSLKNKLVGDTWSLLIFVDKDIALSDVTDMTMLFLLIFLISTVAILFMGIRSAKNIAEPLEIISAFMDKLVSTNDLTLSMDIKSGGRFDEVNRNFNNFIVNLANIVGKVKASVVDTGNATESISKNINVVSEISSGQVVTLSEIQQALNDASDMSLEINQLSDNATGNVNVITSATEQANNAMNDLTSSSEEISNITKVIDDISDQTNLLALNAAIEAARAGDAGRGFAVVSDEVKKLAISTSKSTDEIGKVITELQAQVVTSKETINNITKSVAEIKGQMASVGSAISQQSGAIEEIGSSITAFSSSMDVANESANSSNSEAENLKNKAIQLQEEISVFKTD